jgi:SWIM zinc finger
VKSAKALHILQDGTFFLLPHSLPLDRLKGVLYNPKPFSKEEVAMTPQELERRKERAASEPLIISATENGFRVYSPMNPGNPYHVTGIPDAPVCTCPDFDYHKEDPDWRCKHVLAILGRDKAGQGNGQIAGGNASTRAEQPAQPSDESPIAPTPSQLIIKRSASLDRRIDSLSVEISIPLCGSSEEDSVAAGHALELESDIVDKFLFVTDRMSTEAAEAKEEPGATSAKILGIAGMNTRYGRSLFLTVETNGETAKYFGSRKQLAEAIANTGNPKLAERIEENVLLNLPCRVIAKPSGNGKYVNIVRFLPPAEAKPRGGSGQ